MTGWAEGSDVRRASEYDRRWTEMEEAGESIHGEADLICSFDPRSVLDAGCGTGRVAIELARRAIDVVGVDLDVPMLDTAHRKAPELDWVEADLADVRLTRPDGQPRLFDIVALPGNVMIFLAPGTEGRVVANLAGHLDAGGRLIAGFQLVRLTLEDYDRLALGAGLELEERWSTWQRSPYHGGDYAVSVHRRPG